MQPDISQLVVITGVVRESGAGIALCIDQEDAENRVDYAHVMTWNGSRWRHVERVDWRAVSVCADGDCWLVLGARGQVLVVGDAFEADALAHESVSSEPVTGLTYIRAIDGVAYAVGMRRQVYARSRGGLWSPQDDGARRTSAAEGLVGFQAIDGFGPTELYACGWRGEIWARLDHEWKAVQSPTNLILSDICCGADGLVYAVGQRGTVIRGRGDEWAVVDHDGPKTDLWSVTWYQGRAVVSSLTATFSLDREHLVRLDMGEAGAMSCYHARAAGRWLWSIGLRNICANDGEGEWRRLR